MVVIPSCLGKFLFAFLLKNLETAEGSSPIKLCTGAPCRLAGSWGLNDALKGTTELGYVHKTVGYFNIRSGNLWVWATPVIWHLVNMVEKGSVLFLVIGMLKPCKVTFVSTSN